MSDKYDKFRWFKNKKEEECIKLIKEAPEVCPILGAIKCDSYWFEEGVVYVSQPAYYAFTILNGMKETEFLIIYQLIWIMASLEKIHLLI